MTLSQVRHLKHTLSQKNATDKGIKFLALEYQKPRISGKKKTCGRIYDKAVSVLTFAQTR